MKSSNIPLLLVLTISILIIVGCNGSKIRPLAHVSNDTCRDHHVKMRLDTVLLYHGFVDPAIVMIDSSEKHPACFTSFSNTNYYETSYGKLDEIDDTLTEVLFCPVCRANAVSYYAWMIQNNPQSRNISNFKYRLSEALNHKLY